MTNDPAHYRRMSEPFETVEQSNEALAAFFADVRSARDKHRIAEVVVLCEISVVVNNEEIRGSAMAQHGDSARMLTMLAREFGAEQARHEERIALITARARKAAIR